jgi:glycosyltransferase involved in cell wall biosynthesis
MPEIAPVTLVLVCRNRAGQLPAVLAGIAQSTLWPSEILLCDDASEDESVWAFEEITGRLKLPGRAVKHERGPTLFRINSMRNAGLRASRTERVILLDADHVPAATHLAAHMRMLDLGQKSLSFGPRLEAANADGTGPVNFMWGHEPYAAMSAAPGEPLPYWQLVAGSNLGMHRALAEEVGFFDTDYDGAYGYDDVDFNFRIDRAGGKFYGDFAAHVIHLPHEPALGSRDGTRNAELFRKKNGTALNYPPLVPRVTHAENWAARYAEFRKHGEPTGVIRQTLEKAMGKLLPRSPK